MWTNKGESDIVDDDDDCIDCGWCNNVAHTWVYDVLGNIDFFLPILRTIASHLCVKSVCTRA
jgi:hypothetical protein